MCQIGAYVDDFLIAGRHHDPEFMQLRDLLFAMYRWGEWEKGSFIMCGVHITQNLDYSFKLSQEKYVHEKMTHIDFHHKSPKESGATATEVSQLRGVLGSIQWKVTQTGPQFAAALNHLQSDVTRATTQTLKDANKLVTEIKRGAQPLKIHHHDYVHWKDIASITWHDAAQGDRKDGSSTGGYIRGFGRKDKILAGDWTPISLMSWSTSKLPRVARSSLGAEIQSACIAEEEQYIARLMWAQVNGCTCGNVEDSDAAVNHVPSYMVTDAKALYDAHKSETSALGLKERRSGIELLFLKQNMQRNKTILRWVNSGAMLADSMTRSKARYILESFLRTGVWKLVDDDKFTSLKKRTAGGKDPFEDLPQADYLQTAGKTEPSEQGDGEDTDEELIPA